MGTIKKMMFDQFDVLFSNPTQTPPKYKDFIETTLNYIEEHLSNPNLSLKWIGENLLFMNVDYVSKQFIEQTGSKFSTYLKNARIQKSKEMIAKNPNKKYMSSLKK